MRGTAYIILIRLCTAEGAASCRPLEPTGGRGPAVRGLAGGVAG
jgi:hypothetical protein